jgi:cytochrome c oxidase subunit II
MRRLFSFFFLEHASNFAREVDWIVYALIALCGAMTLLVVALITLLCIRYRRGSNASRKERPTPLTAWSMEIGWTLLPLLIFLALFVWAAEVFFRMSKPPADAAEIYVVGKQWMWKIQHADGRREINELHLPVGGAAKLVMTSQDVIHDFFVPAFRAKQDVLPGCYTTEWFTPTRPGKYHLFCSQYCGTNHATMGGWIYVMEPEEHARWLARTQSAASLVAQGEVTFRTLGCSGCHAENSKIHAPLLEGIYGKPRPLTDQTIVLADDQYLRDSILLPNKQIAAGYEPLMPTFQNQISEEELAALIAYLKSLGGAERKNR